MNKVDLVNKLRESRENFIESIGRFSKEDLVDIEIKDSWTIKDVIVHLTLWEGQLITMLWQAKRHRTPTTRHFDKGLSVDEINQEWLNTYKDRDISTVLSDFHSVRDQTIRRILSFSEKELIDPQAFLWLKGKPLWKWIANDTFEHESEHMQQIKNVN